MSDRKLPRAGVRSPRGSARWRILSLAVVTAIAFGCNALFSIEPATLAEDDAGSSDGSRAEDASIASDGAASESSVLADANIDAAGDGGDASLGGDGGVDAIADTGPPACKALATTSLSDASTSIGGPALAFMGLNQQSFGAVWAASPTELRFHAVPIDGGAAAGEVSVLSDASTPTYDPAPRVATLGGLFAAVAGVNQGGSRASSLARSLTPLGGMGPVLGYGADAAAPGAPAIEGAAFDPAGLFAVVTRPAGGGPVTLERFNPALAFIGAAPLAAGALTANVTAVDAGSVRLAASFVLADGGAYVRLFDGGLGVAGTFPFTVAGDIPLGDTPRHSLAMLGVADRVYLAWMSARSGGEAVYLTDVDMTGGRNNGEALVTGSAIGPQRSYPRLAFDGARVAVAWVEQSGPTAHVFLRRFSTSLAPLDPQPFCVTCPSGASHVDIGLAAAGDNDFGVAYRSATNGRVTFARIACAP